MNQCSMYVLRNICCDEEGTRRKYGWWFCEEHYKMYLRSLHLGINARYVGIHEGKDE
jgi:hypothetical protein